MKKIILLLAFIFVTLFSYGSDGKCDTLYAGKKGIYMVYHTSKNCEFAKNVKIIDISKSKQLRLSNSILCSVCVTPENKQYINEQINLNKLNKLNKPNESINSNCLSLAGKYQRKSAKFHFAAFGTLAGSALMATISSCTIDGYQKHPAPGRTKKALYCIAGVGGVTALALEMCAINFQLKSGKYLEIGAGKVQYNF